MKAKGGNGFEVVHTRTKQKQREVGLVKKVPMDREAAAAVLEWWVDGVE